MARGRPLVRWIKLMLTLGGRPGRTAAELAALRGSGGRREQLRLGSEPPRRSRGQRFFPLA